MSEPVLDASAVLALLNQEPGHEQVLACLPTASIGTVNLTEVISKLCECCVPSDAAMEAVHCLGSKSFFILWNTRCGPETLGR